MRWKVGVTATLRLFDVFCTNLWVEKMKKAEELWRAKPRDWAAWALTGDPG